MELNNELNNQVINGLLLPMNGFHIILPQAVVAEITQRPELSAVENCYADWIKGLFYWRAEQVPLISFEGLCGREENRAHKSTRIAIIDALEGISRVVYYAFELRAIPHPLTLRHDSLQSGKQIENDCEYIASNALFGGHKAVIPHLKQIEHKLSEQLELCRDSDAITAG